MLFFLYLSPTGLFFSRLYIILNKWHLQCRLFSFPATPAIPGICHVKWFHVKEREEKQSYSPNPPSGKTARNVYIHIQPIHWFCLLYAVSITMDISDVGCRGGGLKIFCRSNVLAATAFSAWLILFLFPSSTRQAFHFTTSLSATICYSYCITHAWWKYIYSKQKRSAKEGSIQQMTWVKKKKG